MVRIGGFIIFQFICNVIMAAAAVGAVATVVGAVAAVHLFTVIVLAILPVLVRSSQ